MTKRKQKLTPEQRITVAGYHDRAYGAARFFAIHTLETIVGMKRARTGAFLMPRGRCLAMRDP